VSVTVVTASIPGREAMLAEACASVAAQTKRPLAHLVGVDHAYRGPAPTLNALIATVETDYVARLDDDDLLDPDHLEALLEAAAGVADFTFSWCRHEGIEFDAYRGAFDPADLVAKKDTGLRGCLLFRKDAWERLGGYRDQPIEDWDFAARAAFRGLSFQPVYRETWTYRFHDGNSSHIYDAVLAGRTPPANTYHLIKWIR
jgi:glycosyltransferase involved in cell wall biosynthesis